MLKNTRNHRKSLEAVSQKVLTAQLRQMEASGLLSRTVYPEVPPRVEYTLTELGQSFAPILHSMLAWSEARLPPEQHG